MTGLSVFGRHRIHLYMKALLLSLFLFACQTQPPKTKEQPPEVSSPNETLSREKKELEKSLAKSEATRKEQEEKIADMQMRLVEKDAQINAMEDQLKSQQKTLDEAILEVVRTKAKLRSLESKAEAASNIAEAEIAVKVLKIELGAGDQDADVLKAEQLLKMSAEEFKNENYGGALYLTNQAKGHIKAGQTRLKAVEGTIPYKGEISFPQPLALKVLKKTNLRQGPETSSKVLGRLEKGAPVSGYSYLGEWVRVKSEAGTSGWILRSTVGSR